MPTKAPTNYIETERAITDMMATYGRAMDQLEAGKQQILRARDDLERMNLPAPQGFNSLFQFLGAQAMASPDDADWQSLGSRMVKAEAEFQAKRAEVIALAASISP